MLDIVLWILAMGLLGTVWMHPSRGPASGVGWALIRLPAEQSPRLAAARTPVRVVCAGAARVGLLLALAVTVTPVAT